ncbi:MAG: MATE family efflux transporter [Thermodesulfobacteriota bacterium]
MTSPQTETRPLPSTNLQLEGNPQRPGIWSLAVPSILGNLLFSIVALIQTKFIGSLGGDAMAAVGVGQRVFFTMQAVLMGVSAGTTALVARAWGAGDKDEAGRVTLSSIIMASAPGLLFMIGGMLFSHPIASIFGLNASATYLAGETVYWQTVFVIGLTVNFILSTALRAAGDAWTPLILNIATCVINIPLLFVFIFGYGSIPAMGPAGSALAMSLGLTLGGLALLWIWMRQRLVLKFIKDGWSHRRRFRRLYSLSYPAFLEQALFQIGFVVFLMLIGNYYGTKAFAAYNVGVNMLNIAMVMGFGFSIAGSTLVGQYLGAEDPEGAVRIGWRTCRLAVISMSALALIIVLFAEPFARFFLGKDDLTVKYTVQFTYILAAMLPILGVDVAISGALRGAGDTRFPVLSTFCGLIGMRCGLTLLFTWIGLPVVWVYGTIIGDFVVRGILLVWRFQTGRWKKIISNQMPELEKSKTE